MTKQKKIISVLTAAALLCTGIGTAGISQPLTASAADSIESSMDWDTLNIAGGGFVSGIVTGDDQMYARTDVGGAYRYDYEQKKWVQLLDFLNEADRGFLSVDAMCVDPNDDDTLYLLCGCAYFSDARTVIFRSRDAGETFEEIDVTDLIQVHGNGYGRQTGEAIAVDPDNPNIIYCGGDATAGDSALIMSEDGGDTWSPVMGYDKLGLFEYSIKWPTWTEHMVRSVADDEYLNVNGIATIKITDGKVYVGTSVKGKANLHVAEVGSDDFKPLSEELPTEQMPSRINLDPDGNLLITYINGLMFDSGTGYAYKYNPKTDELKDITPTTTSNGTATKLNVGYGAVASDPKDANKLVATTCAQWYSQSWTADAWDRDAIAWGDRFFKSEDGGETWTEMTPGNTAYWNGPLIANYLQDGGHSWIRDKAIHWSGCIALDPRNSDQFWVVSGNGVFTCEDTWAECPTIRFAADGIEEVVSLDFISRPGKDPVSVIGDYDGFYHNADGTATQLSPSMNKLTTTTASTGGIAYCPANPDVMVRLAEGSAMGYYTTDGTTWQELPNVPLSGAKAAINQLEDGTYRILVSSSGKISYTDDYGKTWSTASTSDSLSSTIWMCVDEKNPQYVYAYGYYYNQYYFYSKPKADITDARYILMVSDDYGKTFKNNQTVCQYDQCDGAYRIAYLDEGTFAIAAGYYGAYLVTDYGKTITKMDSVSYCKTMGYGAAAKDGDPYTLYMYGKPADSDPEGIYRSTDCGKSWVLINQNHLYGGTGNGNYLVGDMNTFGTVYMSTVGCGIVVGKVNGSEDPKPVTTDTTQTTKATTTTTSTTTVSTAASTKDSAASTTIATTIVTTLPQTTDSTGVSTTASGKNTATVPAGATLYGDTNLDGRVDITDAVLLNKAAAGAVSLAAQAAKNADCNANGEVGSDDAVSLLKFLVQIIKNLPEVAE
ncbi:MAG: dockerin type I domain-containing protein [Ruminococcus callidus]|uniref:dockerin type I domain-containing protein n=1 Tax=Ruminococcus callidus TaxID=40519 RepID=UPI0039A0407D